MAQLQIVQKVNRSMQCSSCGAPGTAACDCGAPYVPATAKAIAALAADDRKSDRIIAAEIGVSRATVQRARPPGSHEPPGKRVGRDGKAYRMPKKPVEDVMPTHEEADESFQNDLYDIACNIVDVEMSGKTRQRFFAHLGRKYNGTVSQTPDQKAAKGLLAYGLPRRPRPQQGN